MLAMVWLSVTYRPMCNQKACVVKKVRQEVVEQQ